MTVRNHRLKDSVGICLTAIGPLGGRVHPNENDHHELSQAKGWPMEERTLKC
jgi:hypothetical protein